MTDSATTAFAFDRIDRRTRQVTPRLIGAVVDRIIQRLHPNQVILFGSQATGEASQDSDIDLFIRLYDAHDLASLSRRQRAIQVLDLFRYRWFGLDVLVLTDTYNRLHNPKEKATDIAHLRELHVEVDNTVAAAYGWGDLDLGHGFHETPRRIRYTISEEARREVLSRLLRLNHERYEEEVRMGLHDNKKT